MMGSSKFTFQENGPSIKHVIILKSDEEMIRKAIEKGEIVESSMLEGWAPSKAAYDLVKASIKFGVHEESLG